MGRELHLTFDDGPHPEWTPRILDMLAAAGAKGHIFLCRRKHVSATLPFLTASEMRAQLGQPHHAPRIRLDHRSICLPQELPRIARHITQSGLFRPPYGRMTSGHRRRSIAMRSRIVMWDLLTGDFDHKRTARAMSHQHLGPPASRLHRGHARQRKASPRTLGLLAGMLAEDGRQGWKGRPRHAGATIARDSHNNGLGRLTGDY